MVKQRQGFAVIIKPLAIERESKGQCPSCGKPKQEWKRRTDWRCCSKECTEKYHEEMIIAFGWGDLRRQAIRRDGHRCVKCGKRPLERIRIDSDYQRSMISGWKSFREFIIEDGKEYAVLNTYESLIVDHIVPIALGGEEWDLNNLQTLCAECNKAKTAMDQAAIAQLRRKEKLAEKAAKTGQRTLMSSVGVVPPGDTASEMKTR